MFSEFSFLEFSGLHYCLFVKVLCAAFSAATVDILSHVVWTVKHFFQLFLFLSSCCSIASAVEFYYSIMFRQMSTSFLTYFYKSFSYVFHLAKVRKKRNLNHLRFFFREAIIASLISVKGTEKEGFEPSRRYKRPTPLAGAPLQPLEYFSTELN